MLGDLDRHRHVRYSHDCFVFRRFDRGCTFIFSRASGLAASLIEALLTLYWKAVIISAKDIGTTSRRRIPRQQTNRHWSNGAVKWRQAKPLGFAPARIFLHEYCMQLGCLLCSSNSPRTVREFVGTLVWPCDPQEHHEVHASNVCRSTRPPSLPTRSGPVHDAETMVNIRVRFERCIASHPNISARLTVLSLAVQYPAPTLPTALSFASAPTMHLPIRDLTRVELASVARGRPADYDA